MLDNEQEPSHGAAYSSSIGAGFDRSRIAKALAGIPGLAVQPDVYQHAQKSSWYLRDADAVTPGRG